VKARPTLAFAWLLLAVLCANLYWLSRGEDVYDALSVSAFENLAVSMARLVASHLLFSIVLASCERNDD
jgi:hypothetical protein